MNVAPDQKIILGLQIFLEKIIEFNRSNIAKGTTDPGVDYFNQLLWFGLVELVQ